MLLGLIIALKHLIYLMVLSKVVSYRHYSSFYYLLPELRTSDLGCHVGLTYACAFGYAYDVALIAPLIYSLEKMIITCENYARTHCITFNPSKPKLMCFNTDSCHNVRIYINNLPIVNTKHDIHLGDFLSSHGLINKFRTCDCITLDNLHRTYCMHIII